MTHVRKPSILLVSSGKAFLPEISAYEKFFSEHGCDVMIRSETSSFRSEFDVVIRFPGILIDSRYASSIEIHDYNSLSVGRFGRFKDVVKTLFNRKPDLLIFQSPNVQKHLRFLSPSVPYLYRAMGVDAEFLDVRTSREGGKPFDFDLVYCGSLSSRPAVIKTILRICKSSDLRVAVAGDISREDRAVLSLIKNPPKIFGVLNRSKILSLYERSFMGLNVMPDLFPLNEQEATKVLEYAVSGMPIVSNSYNWINRFSSDLGISYIDIDRFILGGCKIERYDLAGSVFISPSKDIKKLIWNQVLEKSGIISALNSLGKDEWSI